MKKKFLLVSFLAYACHSQAQLVIKSGSELKTTNGALITLNNIDLIIDGTINQMPGDGKFVFTGSANNSISGSSTPLFDIFEIAKSGTARCSLLQNINIGTAVNFTSGLIDMDNSNILMQPNALLNGEGENSRITASGNGYIEITKLLNNPVSYNPGNLGASISSAQNLGSTIIRRGHTSQTNVNNAGNSIYRYFDIIPANNSALNATLRFNYFDAELNGLTESSLVFWKSNNNTNWTNIGFTTRDVTLNYVEKTGLADFSRWTLSTFDNPLPVHFVSFTVTCTNTGASIVWKTAYEQNSNMFYVEKSNDGIQFNIIGSVPASGYSSTGRYYSFIDSSNFSEPVFYRIRETDRDRNIQYTAINRLICSSVSDEIKIWPNPVQQMLFLNINASLAVPVSFKIFDQKGALVLIQEGNLKKGANQFNIVVKNLASGIYSLVAAWNYGKHQTVKFLKL